VREAGFNEELLWRVGCLAGLKFQAVGWLFLVAGAVVLPPLAGLVSHFLGSCGETSVDDLELLGVIAGGSKRHLVDEFDGVEELVGTCDVFAGHLIQLSIIISCHEVVRVVYLVVVRKNVD
jgi:hypothetical protein